jgi:hypothetical protein
MKKFQEYIIRIGISFIKIFSPVNVKLLIYQTYIIYNDHGLKI